MILTDEQMREVRQSIEAQAGLDAELMRRCGDLIHMGKFDEAIRSAFVLLEERLRKITNKGGMTGTQLANYAFGSRNDSLAKYLAYTPSEQEGLRELYAGAFKLFRNPTAHGVVGYDAAEGKAIIGLVNLMLKLLKRVEELPPSGLLPDNVEAALSEVEETVGPGAASRLRMFLGKCVRAGIQPTNDKGWIPFRSPALVKYDRWDRPKPHRIPVFHLYPGKSGRGIAFGVQRYHSKVVGFDVSSLTEQLLALEFQIAGTRKDLRVSLRFHNDQEFFDALFDLVAQTAEELAETLEETE